MSSSQHPASSLKDEELKGREEIFSGQDGEEQLGSLKPEHPGDDVPSTSNDGGVSGDPSVVDVMPEAEKRQNDTEPVTSGGPDGSSETGLLDQLEEAKDVTLPERLESLSVSSKRPEAIRTQNLDGGLLDIPPPPPIKDELYLDPTPKTPLAPQSPARADSDYNEKELPEVPQKGEDGEFNEKRPAGNGGRSSEDSQSEIQSIMDQFTDDTGAHAEEEIMSPRLEFASHVLGSGPAHFPPRKSSLEPSMSSDTASERPVLAPPARNSIVSPDQGPFAPPAVPPKSPPSSLQRAASNNEGPISPTSSSSAPRPPLPEPEPDQPFDFHRFLEQLRHRTADPVAKFLRSFLNEFGKKQWMVHEQVKIISDFLAFITNKMALCEVWRDVSDVEFDNAKEGMEKLVMNRLYSQTFSPAIPPPQIPARSRSRSKRREMERTQGPGRRGQHQEDVERDEVLAQKVRIYGWVREAHLDIPPVGPNGRRFLNLAQQGTDRLWKLKGFC